jgi:hypothetical protein
VLLYSFSPLPSCDFLIFSREAKSVIVPLSYSSSLSFGGVSLFALFYPSNFSEPTKIVHLHLEWSAKINSIPVLPSYASLGLG